MYLQYTYFESALLIIIIKKLINCSGAKASVGGVNIQTKQCQKKHQDNVATHQTICCI